MIDWKTLAVQIAMLALGSLPKTRGLAPYIGPAVAATEDLLHGKTGAEKLAHGIELVKIGITGANTVRPGTIDPDVSDALIAHAVSTVVDATNLLHKQLTAAPAA